MTFSIYQLKPGFQRLLRPLVHGLAARGVTPNQVTLATCAGVVAYGVATACAPSQRALWLGWVAVQPLRMALNAIDGLLAVHTDRRTRLGAILNEACDVAADLATALPVALLPGVSAPLAVVAAALGAVSEQAGLAAVAAGGARRFDGPMGKSDRAVAYGLVGLLAGLGVDARWIDGVLLVVAAGLLLTLLNRVRAGAAPPTP